MRRLIALIFCIAVASLGPFSFANADTVAVIGTGLMGGAVGPRFAELGHDVVYGSRNPSAQKVIDLVARTPGNARATSQEEAVKNVDIVVLVVPWRATEELVKRLAPLDGKIVVDITNAPLAFFQGAATGDPVETSAGELIQTWLPGAKVVKAFNAMGYTTVTDPTSAGGPVTVPIVGNNLEAKQLIAQMIEEMGFETIDLGPIENSHALEAMAKLLIIPFLEGRREDSFEYYFRRNSPNDE